MVEHVLYPQSCPQGFHPKVVVFGIDVGRPIMQLFLADAVGTHHHGGMGQNGALRHQFQCHGIAFKAVFKGFLYTPREVHHSTENVNFGMSEHIVHLHFQPLGHHHVIGIHACDEIALPFVEQAIDGADIIVMILQQANARIIVRTHNFHAFIGRTVIYDE